MQIMPIVSQHLHLKGLITTGLRDCWATLGQLGARLYVQDIHGVDSYLVGGQLCTLRHSQIDGTRCFI